MKKRTQRKFLHISLAAVLAIFGFNYFFNQDSVEEEVLAASESKQEKNTSVTKTSSNIDNYLSDDTFNGIAITLKDGDVSSCATYGYSNFDTQTENDLDTLFPVASLQKMMTASLVAKAVSADKLTYDTQLSDFYPEIENSESITIRDLLNQTSGIKMDEVAPDSVLTTQEEQIDYVLDNLTSTGENDFNYTNANYSLLAGILSTVSNKSYEELFTEEIIEPLQLTQTYFWDTVPEEEVAKAYDTTLLLGDYKVGEDDFVNSKELYSSLIGAGNVIMSGNDLVTFLENLTNGTLLTSEELSTLLDGEDSYTSAFWKNDGLLQTNGSLGNYTSSVFVDQNGEDMVVLISNGNKIDSISDLASTIYNDTIV